MASYFGKHIHISIFGQSHSQVIGVTVDGLPAGESVDLEDSNAFSIVAPLDWDTTATARKEGDIPRILCGLLEGVTCGAPLTAVIENTNIRSQDYNDLCDKPRPAHADFTAQIKYGGHQDVRGGGHFSGRLTAPLCIAGGICAQLLSRRGIPVDAHIRASPESRINHSARWGERKKCSTGSGGLIPGAGPRGGEPMRADILEARSKGDSVGGVVECMVTGLPAGVRSPLRRNGEPLAAAIFGIPAVKGVEFGAGFEAAEMLGSEHNDPFVVEDGQIRTATNHAGGILGGITKECRWYSGRPLSPPHPSPGSRTACPSAGWSLPSCR